MYKIRNGFTLPKEFKIRVNPKQSEAIQKELFAKGFCWHGGKKNILHIESEYLFFDEGNLTHLSKYTNDSRGWFRENPNREIDFLKYFEKEGKSFPKKWCILVTEKNYKELNKWMHRNWKKYKGYKDTWDVYFEEKDLYFHSESKMHYYNIVHSNDKIVDGFKLITTEQFRERFGAKEENYFSIPSVNAFRSVYARQPERTFKNIVDEMEHNSEDLKKQICQRYKQVADALVNTAKVINETKAQGTEPGEKEYIVADMYVIGSDKWEEKAKYYKEKSDRLRKEKFDLNFKIGNLYGEINTLKEKNQGNVAQLNSLSSHIMLHDDEIKRLKNIIAENNAIQVVIQDYITQRSHLTDDYITLNSEYEKLRRENKKLKNQINLK